RAVFLPAQHADVQLLLRHAGAPVPQSAYELLQLHALAVRLFLPPPDVRPPLWFFVPPLFGPARELLQLRVGRPRPHARGDLLLPGPSGDSLLLLLTCAPLPLRVSAPLRPPRVCARPLRPFVALLLERAWMPALLRLAFARLQPRRAAAMLPVRRVCRQPLLWRVDGPRRPLAGALPQRGVVRPRLRAPIDWPLPKRVVFLRLLLLRACGPRLRPTAGPLPLRRVFARLLPGLLGELLLLRACVRLPPQPA